ncbi:CobQ/CobB/MinD/ParA nucleotide binding domain-containing protein, DUF4388-containing [Desulfonema limicola]|uniref:CobQ/CobB/MinD/ParA nucleotide binding domain-containing protein, DUF4388-containing n=1 Tax=Desulfonema limicola TaxID=45656 RepID=A0A975B5H5_9BACT|nr:DUF4388 domain-containing protein [Desulfonema limicola]QTA79178.1 CobQ/CobB/MinD/ParA nucleotide binding domain-containing protein, DUF4388-containing [Desulfonema limicola]
MSKLNKTIKDIYGDTLLDGARTQSRFAEAYRTLRTNIHFSVMGKSPKSILITSAAQSEGKTVTVSNLAYNVAQTGKKILVVDADLRKPMLTKIFNARKSAGLTGVLSEVFNSDVKSGSLDDYTIHDLFRLLSLQKRTGLLHLSSEKEIVELRFIEGRLIDIEWKTRPEERKLANVLVENEVLPLEHAKVALMRCKDTGQKLGDVLLYMGLIKEDDLKGPLNIHAMESFQAMSNMKTGNFYFSEQPKSQYVPTAFDFVDIEKMYMQIMGKNEVFNYIKTRINSIIVSTEISGLFILPSGLIPLNPGELLGSERMAFLVSWLAKEFDFVIFDTPPILPASDALLLAPQTDGVAIVVKAGFLRRNMNRRAVEHLRRTGANLLGVILNGVDVKREGYYKYYQKYYANYYSETKQ